jgi:signal transduction histidine kinase
MKVSRHSTRVRLQVILTMALLVWIVGSVSPGVTQEQQSKSSKGVLVLDWYDRDFFWNVKFDGSFQAALQSSPDGNVEYYPEYLESNRFPGESQALLLRDYLRQKYADRTIDVVVANSDASLDFLLKYRKDLFPDAPIVFVATRHPSKEELAAGPGLTGLVNINAYRKTLDLALRLHPDTEEVFVISGTLERDSRFEQQARKEFEDYESKVRISYLTDLTLEELIAKTKSLQKRSVVLHVWQQSRNEQGEVLESADMLAPIARSASVPLYGMTFRSVFESEGSIHGTGVIGGYVNWPEAIGAKAAEIALRIANGARAQEIPVEQAPSVPMFDWRELQRWGITESTLPSGSIILFKETSFWELYRWRILAVMALLSIETLLIAGLLVQRSRRARAEASSRLSAERLQQLTGRLIHVQDDERRRIAAELHDGLGQSLVAINIRAQIGLRDEDDPDRVKQQFEEISFAATSAIDTVREIAHNLRPHELENLGLVKAVKSMVAKVAESSSIRVSLELDELDGLLSIEAETSVYRIIQEGLNNIVKHADATEAQISVKRIGKELTIKVADNGKGISKPMSNKAGNGLGVGLTGIAERVRMLGGSFVVDSAPGQGTVLTLVLRLTPVEN